MEDSYRRLVERAGRYHVGAPGWHSSGPIRVWTFEKPDPDFKRREVGFTSDLKERKR